LNEANTGLAMKYNELIATQVAQTPTQPPAPAHIPTPDDIKSTMERILTQIDGE
jgi:hypothetical protein